MEGPKYGYWNRESTDFIQDKNISKNTNITCVIGNHDYTVQKFYNNFKKDFPNEKYAFEVGKFLRLNDGDSKFYFMHGYQLEVMTSLEP